MASLIGRCGMTEQKGAFSMDLKAAILNALTGGDGSLFGAKAVLFTNNVLPTPSTLPGDLDLPAWTGWAAADVTWTSSGPDGANNVIVQTESIHWIAGANADATVYGFALLDDSLATIWASAQFDEPAAITASEPITLVVQLEL